MGYCNKCKEMISNKEKYILNPKDLEEGLYHIKCYNKIKNDKNL